MSESFEDQNVLVVGGAGFVGSNLVRFILGEAPRKVTIVDNFLSADPVNVPETRRSSSWSRARSPMTASCARSTTTSTTPSTSPAITATSRRFTIRWSITTTTR